MVLENNLSVSYLILEPAPNLHSVALVKEGPDSPEASKYRLRTEEDIIVLNILQLHRMKKQPDEDPMEKGARDGKACGAMAFALNFLWLLSLFQDKESDKSTIQLICCGKIPL